MARDHAREMDIAAASSASLPFSQAPASSPPTFVLREIPDRLESILQAIDNLDVDPDNSDNC